VFGLVADDVGGDLDDVGVGRTGGGEGQAAESDSNIGRKYGSMVFPRVSRQVPLRPASTSSCHEIGSYARDVLLLASKFVRGRPVFGARYGVRRVE
jgi:hypothetical protein